MTGPGPNKYLLPRLTGYDYHDPTKFRHPAYSVGFRFDKEGNSTKSPGPKYNPQQYVRTGKFTGPSALVLSRHGADPINNGIPAPTKYNPPKDPSHQNSPSAVVLPRREEMKQSGVIPGPKYLVKGTVGRPIEELESAPAWSILGRNIELDINRNSPGPRYKAVDLKFTKKKYPEATVISRHEPPSGGIIPGPKYHGPYRALKCQEPSWSFGTRHSERKAELWTNEDRQPFYGF